MPYRLLVRAASRAGGRLGWARAMVGAALGLVLAAVANHLVMKLAGVSLPWLLAPVGASAVLVFALPASPLAQPWPVFGGNLLSAAIGLIAAQAIPYPEAACAVAVGAAIAAMSVLRCLHPPGGACALLAAIGGPLASDLAALHFLLPLAVNLVALMLAAGFYNRLTGHSWPHRAQPIAPQPAPGWTAHYDERDLDAVLEQWDEVLDISRGDLDALFRALERRVLERARLLADALREG
jgi:CBS domain-containing membrane protein